MWKDYRIDREYAKRVGERLTELRNETGLTQTEVANRLDIDRNLLSQFENGIRALDVPSCIALSSFYGVSTDYIAGTSTHRIFKGFSTSDKLDLELLSPTGRHLIFDFYHSLLNCPGMTIRDKTSGK